MSKESHQCRREFCLLALVFRLSFVFFFLLLRIQCPSLGKAPINGRRSSSVWNLVSGLCVLLKTMHHISAIPVNVSSLTVFSRERPDRHSSTVISRRILSKIVHNLRRKCHGEVCKSELARCFSFKMSHW